MGGWQSREEDPEPWRIWSAVGSAVFAGALALQFFSVPGIVGKMVFPYADLIKQIFTGAMMLLFGRSVYCMAKPTAAAKAKTKAKVDRVIADPDASEDGLTREWYDSAAKILSGLQTALLLGVAAAFLSAVFEAYPTSLETAASQAWASTITSYWKYLRSNYTDWQLFVVGNWLGFSSGFWLMGVIFTVIDYTRPSAIYPFRIQQKTWPTRNEYLRATGLALCSTVIFFFLFWGVYLLIPDFAPGTFAATPPGIGELLVQVIYSAAVAEGFFFSAHALLHMPYLYKHIHSWHHQFMAPFSITAVAAHPVEVVFGDFALFIGPFFCNSHITFWLPATFMGAIFTCYNHCGYQFPIPIPGYVGPNHFHDFHHSHVPGPEGCQNYGVLGFCDTFFRTNAFYENRSWQAKVDKGYATPNMPVDRILAQRGELTDEKEMEAAAFVLGAPEKAQPPMVPEL